MDASGIRDDQAPLGHLRREPLVLLSVSQIVLALIIALTTCLLVMHSREHRIAAAEREVTNLALILADQAERAFEAVELVQTAIQERSSNEGARSPDAFRQFMSGLAVQKDLRRRGGALPQLDAMIISDAAGDVINSSRPEFALEPRINLAYRDFFRQLKADPRRTVIISEALQSVAAGGKWTAYIARRVSGPDGEFLGTIEGAVELSYFENLYRAVAPGPGGAVTLDRQDGRLLVRYPPVDMAAAQGFTTSERTQIARAAGGGVVVIQKRSVFDHEERLMAVRSLMHYPVTVTVSNKLSSILAVWRQDATYLVGSAVILELVVATVGILMLRQLRSQRMLTEAHAARAEAEASRLAAEAELAVAREHERAARELGLQNVRFGAALSNLSQALSMFDSSDRLVVCNARHEEMFGLPAGKIVPGMTMDALMDLADGQSNLASTDVELVRASCKMLKAAGKRASFFRELTDGRTLSVNFAPIQNEGWLVTFEDITERRTAAAKLTHMAHYDALTGLPNRILFHAKLGEAVARSRRGEACAVLYLDLDHFKVVNDTLGHPQGDALLQVITARLLAQIREADTAARLGGDEFAIVQSSVHQPHDATALAKRLVETLGEPYDLDGQQVHIGTSIGIALVPADGEDPVQILKNADMALYHAKADGRGCYCFFAPEMDKRLRARRALEIDLRKAPAAKEFELFYQPLINLKTGAVTGFEALMRWFHPRRGMVAPADFIPLAEEIGLLVPLGKWALRRACRDAVTWPGKMKVAVNVSVTQFAGHDLVGDVADALAELGLDPGQLELEITETVMLDATDATLVILHKLRDLGVGIAMDDFGTGYSSLSYLQRFPFSKVKIDQSFVAGLGKGGDCDAIVASVTDLCATLGMIALAEGVETEDQLQRLRAGNCEEAQGYLFSRPRPAADVPAMCRAVTLPEPVDVAA